MRMNLLLGMADDITNVFQPSYAIQETSVFPSKAVRALDVAISQRNTILVECDRHSPVYCLGKSLTGQRMTIEDQLRLRHKAGSLGVRRFGRTASVVALLRNRLMSVGTVFGGTQYLTVGNSTALNLYTYSITQTLNRLFIRQIAVSDQATSDAPGGPDFSRAKVPPNGSALANPSRAGSLMGSLMSAASPRASSVLINTNPMSD